MRKTRRFQTAALFAGIGGLELGLQSQGHKTILFSEIDPGAVAVLRERFRGTPVLGDVRQIDNLPQGTNLITAGFPCQDLSQAGETRGITGHNSGLVNEVFRLAKRSQVPWILLENVPFMLQLNHGDAIRFVTASLENLGYSWAYRVMDTRSFGLPQRRERVFLIASLEEDPSGILFSDDVGKPKELQHEGYACGFYWTEGTRGLGWAVNAIPTLKNGSTIGIPSPPAIWMPDGRIITPDIRDAERLQGFQVDWTKPAELVGRPSYRWKLVGNAVTVNASTWVAEKLSAPGSVRPLRTFPLPERGSWPKAAFGSPRERFGVEVSMWPCRTRMPKLQDFLLFDQKPLSLKAATGFMNRLQKSSLRYPREFAKAIDKHIQRMGRE